jgi:hypothetical protein
MTRWRFRVAGHGVGIEVRAESEALAWVALRSRYPDATVLGGRPERVGPAAEQPVRLAEVVGRSREGGA